MSQQINVDVKGTVDKQLIDGLDKAVTGAEKLADTLKKLPKNLPSMGGSALPQMRTDTDALSVAMATNTSAIRKSADATKGYVSEVARATQANDMVAVATLKSKIAQEKSNIAMANAALAAAKEKNAVAGLSGKLSTVEQASLAAAKAQNRLATTMAGQAVSGANSLQGSVKGLGHEVKGLSAVAGVMQGSLGSIAGRLHALSFLFDGVSKSTIAAGASMAALLGSLSLIVPASIKLEKTMSKLEAVTHSNGAAFAIVKEESARTGASLDVLGDSFANISVASADAGISAEDAEGVFRALNTASQAMGMSVDDTSGIMKAMTQIMSKGTVQMEELKGQLGDRLPGALGKAAKAMDTNVQSLTKMIEQGQVLASDFVPKFAKVLQEDYADAALIAGKTVAGSMRKVSAQFELLSGSVMNGGIVMGGLAALLNVVSKAFETMNEHPRTTQILFTALAVATTVYAGQMLFASAAGVALANSLKLVAVAGLAANATTGGLIIAAGLLVSALVAFSLDEAYAVGDTTISKAGDLTTKVNELDAATRRLIAAQKEEEGWFSKIGRAEKDGWEGMTIWLDSMKDAPETIGGTYLALSDINEAILDKQKLMAGAGNDQVLLNQYTQQIDIMQSRAAQLEATINRTRDGGKGAGVSGDTGEAALSAMALKYQKLAKMGVIFDGTEQSRIAGRLAITQLSIDAEKNAFVASQDYKVTATGDYTQRTLNVLAGFDAKRKAAEDVAAAATAALDKKNAKGAVVLNMAKYNALAAFGARYAGTETSRAQAQLDVKLLAIQAEEDAFKASAERKSLSTAEIYNVDAAFTAQRIDAAQQTSNKIIAIEEAETARKLQITTDATNARLRQEQSITAFISASSSVRGDISSAADETTIVNMGTMVSNYSKMTDAFDKMDKDSADYSFAVAKGSLDMLTGLMNSTTRGQFELGKAAAYANTLLSTYEGVMKAWGQGGVFGFIGAGVIAAAGAANLQKIASTTMGSKGAKATAGADPSKSLQGTMPTSAPTQQAAAPTIINIHNTGNVMTDAFVLDNIIPSIQNVVATGDAILVSQ
ncbi:MAG: tape measure protein, partial [Ghiorsea sp.]